MKLSIFFDHRYSHSSNGTLVSPSHYNYDFFQSRYLQVFDHVDIISRTPEPVGSRVSLGTGVDVISVGSWDGAIDYFRKKSEIKRLIKNILAEKTAVLMIVPGKLGELAYRDLQRVHHPYSVEVVGDSYQSLAPGTMKHPLRPLFRIQYSQQQKKLCAHASGSSYVTEHALQKNYPPAEDSFSTHCSDIVLDENHFSPAPKSFGNHGSRWRLVNVGTMNVYYKGQTQLIEAVSLCRKMGLEVSLALLGDGAIRSELEALAVQLGVQDSVSFLGHLPPGGPVRAELDRSDLFVLPSFTEGLPRALVEAMARGLPCIGTDIPGIAELLTQESLVPVKESGLLAEKIASFINQPDLLDRHAAGNHSKAQEYLNSLLMGRRLEFYNHLYDITTAYFGNASVKRKAA